jgi:DNA polymerase-3 subunit alpha
MYINCHQHSHYSLLDGLSKPTDIAKRAKELGQTHIALTDHGGVNGSVEFQLACKKEGIIPIQGVELYICKNDPSDQTPENRNLSHLVVLAKNFNGWKTLLKIIDETNKPQNYYYKPRISLKRLGELNSNKNLISFSGHLGSTVSDVLLDENNKVRQNWEKEVEQSIGLHEDIFGKDNFFVEIQTIDAKNTPICQVLGDNLRNWAKKNGKKVVATADSHYTKPDDIELHQIILSSAIKKSVPELKRGLAQGLDIPFRAFFSGHGEFYIPSHERMSKCNTQEEIENTFVIASMCDNYDITNKPFMPKFDCPDGLNSNEYLRKLCNDSIAEKNLDTPEYRNRMEMEFSVIEKAGLSPYFLVVQDYVNWATNQGILTGPGRGSAGGCLVSYLTKITRVDPIKYNLIFERFYNDGRNTPDRVALPDIDVDFEVSAREGVVEYIREKYGRNNVCQIAAYGRMMGRGALKDVFRAYDVSFDLSNEVSKFIPGEAEVIDEIQEIEDHSIIRWALQNRTDKLAQFCEVDRETFEPKCEGDLGVYFKHAMKLEGTKRNSSRHPAGVIICDRPLVDIAPMIYDSKSKQQICGWDLKSAETAGLCKVDCLAVASLDKLGKALRLINASQ